MPDDKDNQHTHPGAGVTILLTREMECKVRGEIFRGVTWSHGHTLLRAARDRKHTTPDPSHIKKRRSYVLI